MNSNILNKPTQVSGYISLNKTVSLSALKKKLQSNLGVQNAKDYGKKAADYLDKYRKMHRYGETHLLTLNHRLDAFPTMRDEISWILNTQTRTKNGAENNIALDGVSCCFKSSIISPFKYYKINSAIQNALPFYNICANVAMDYFVLSCHAMDTAKSMIFDRSPIANIAFQYVYYMMNQMSAKGNYLSCHGVCQQYTEMHHLTSLFEYVRAKDYRVIILIDTDYNKWCERMIKRGGESDIGKSFSRDYHRAQNAAYSYIASVLGYPIIDIAWLRDRYYTDSTYAGEEVLPSTEIEEQYDDEGVSMSMECNFISSIINIIQSYLHTFVNQSSYQYPTVLANVTDENNTLNSHVKTLLFSNR